MARTMITKVLLIAIALVGVVSANDRCQGCVSFVMKASMTMADQLAEVHSGSDVSCRSLCGNAFTDSSLAACDEICALLGVENVPLLFQSEISDPYGECVVWDMCEAGDNEDAIHLEEEGVTESHFIFLEQSAELGVHAPLTTVSAPAAPGTKKPVRLNSDLSVKGYTSVQAIYTPTGKLKIEADFSAPKLNLDKLTMDKMTVDVLSTNTIVAPSKNLTLQGGLRAPSLIVEKIVAASDPIQIVNDWDTTKELSSKSIRSNRTESPVLVTPSIRATSKNIKIGNSISVEKMLSTRQFGSVGGKLGIAGSVNVNRSLTTPAMRLSEIHPITPGRPVEVTGNMTITNGTLRLGAITPLEKSVLITSESITLKGLFTAPESQLEKIQSPSNNVTVVGSLDQDKTKTLFCKFLGSPTGTVHWKTGMTVSGAVKSNKLSSTNLMTSFLQLDAISSGSEAPIQVGGSLKSDGHISSSALSGDSLHAHGQRQWQLVGMDDFSSHSDGWTAGDLQTCGADQFLGGGCSVGKTEKVFNNLPPHSEVRLSGRYHFIDNWSGEGAFAQLDGGHVWMDSFKSSKSQRSLNVCGGEAPEGRLSAPLEATINHSSDSVKVSFGSTRAPSNCDGSWGVDDVQIYVR